jgi:DNA-binding Lrp family transcriptional regulator
MKKTFPIIYGQPRSGTSLLMRVLEMGGVECEYDKSKPEVETRFRNIYGMFETRNPNPKKCFKCVNPKFIKEAENVKIIYISRNPEQQAKSWDRINPENPDHLSRVKRVREMFQKALEGKEYLHITYEDMHKNPRKECERIKEFLGEFDVESAVKAVDKSLLVIR